MYAMSGFSDPNGRASHHLDRTLHVCDRELGKGSC